jgi:acyl-CoA synthetase (AMP-forming)/AMP-acid ligase II
MPRSTLVDLLHERATQTPEHQVYTFLSDGETEKDSLTYAQLERKARVLAKTLRGHAAFGDRVVLLYPPGLEFVSAFFGCLYAGMIPVPAFPPRNNRNMDRLMAIMQDADATVALMTEPIRSMIAASYSETPGLDAVVCLATETLADEDAAWERPPLDGDSVCFLQYTSGSTGIPKGVMVSHGNLLANMEDIATGLELSEETVSVSWLPFYHDMGLIYGVLLPVFSGFRVYLMAPIAFLQRPIRWLKAITRYRGTLSSAPNFAYDLCVRKVTPEMRETLDLHAWASAANGAEPLRRETLENFAQHFAPAGFKREALRPCYGLAEGTLKVTVAPVARAPIYLEVDPSELEQNRVVPAAGPNARLLVGSGVTLRAGVTIVHPETLKVCGPHEVGEIWVSGDAVAKGYWKRPEETERTFQAKTSDTGEGPFLRTGDLGFLHDGELFVTGRIKDLIIIRGRNHYPQDIERTIERCHPSLRQGCSASFSVEVSGEERLVVVAEVERRHQPDRNQPTPGNAQAMEERMDHFELAPAPLDQKLVRDQIRQAVSEQFDVMVHDVVLIKATTIPKTSSGKIQRQSCRAAYLEGRLETVIR